jgi:hemerythrin-like domain-containing protein
MKRNVHLQPLSRQHHNGLLAVLLLNKGVAKNADVVAMQTFINHFFTSDLDEHFTLEEKYLVPVMQQYPALKEHAGRIIDEHALLHQLQIDISTLPTVENINAFADLLEQHIRFEERHAFPASEKYFAEEDFNQLGTFLSHHDDKNCMSYPVKFWE